MKYGIDEAGRGPIAGPVAVAIFGFTKTPIVMKTFPKGRDSKKMSEREREFWFSIFEKEREEGRVLYNVGFASPTIIDRRGISFAIKSIVKQLLKKINTDCIILLDGSLKAPTEFKNQTTIIKGDEKEVLIACASIVAKVSRDRLMKKLSKKFPSYLFEEHKGYGTRKHQYAILKMGLTEIHRKTFCKSLIENSHKIS